MKADNSPKTLLLYRNLEKTCSKQMILNGTANGPVKTIELSGLSKNPTPEESQSINIKQPRIRKPREAKSYIQAKITLSKGELAGFKNLLNTVSKFLKTKIILELDYDRLTIRAYDCKRELIAHYLFPKSVFEEFFIIPPQNRRLRPAKLPVLFMANVTDFLAAIKDAKAYAKVIIEFNLMFSRTKIVAPMVFFKPTSCPNCDVLINNENNKREHNKRGKHNNLYMCECGWKSKVRSKIKNESRYLDALKIDESNAFVTTIQNDEKDQCPLNLYQDTPEVIALPRTCSLTTHKIDPSEFLKKIAKIQRLNDYFALIGSEKELTLEGLPISSNPFNQNSNPKITIKKGSEILINSKGLEPQRAIFKIKPFQNLMPKKKGVADRIVLEWSTGCPIKISWQMNDLPEATIQFFLAPQKENNISENNHPKLTHHKKQD